jgi:hypothetical protein
MLREVLDHHFGEIGAAAAERHRQIEGQRITRFRIEGKAIAAVRGPGIKPEGRRAVRDPVIVGGREGQLHLSRGLPAQLAFERHDRGGIGQNRDVPGLRAGRREDRKRAGPFDDQGLRGARPPRRAAAGRGRTDRDILGIAVEAQADAAALRGLEPLGGDVVEIERRKPGVDRRFDPAFPGRSRGRRGARPDGHGVPHIRHAAERAEQQRHGQGRRRDIAQRVGIAGRQAQVRLRRAGGGGPRPAMRATWTAQTDCVAGSSWPTATVSRSAVIGRPGIVRSSRSSASSWLGILKARIPRRPPRRWPKTGGARGPDTGGPSKPVAPKATAASAMNSSDQSGQNARVARSATMPARVRRRGQIRRRSASSCGSLVGHAPFRVACRMRASGRMGSYPLGNSIAVYDLVKCRTRPDDGELIAFTRTSGISGRVLYSLAITAP